jgi:tetratricopeptide (TPR) repeat protein
MKWILTLIFTLFVAGFAMAAGPDDQYVTIYDLIQQGDTLNKSGQLPMAAEKYQEAQAQLKQLQSVSPNWNTDVVTFRLNYLAEKLQELKKYVKEKPAAPVETKPAAVAKPTQESLEQQVAELQNQVQQLSADKSKLEAKLKEALSAQPAAVDPQELAKANATIAALTKERDLLAVTLEQEKQKSKGANDTEVASLRQQLAAALEELANAKKHAQQETAALRAEIAQLKQASKESEKKVAVASTVTPLNANDVEKFNALTKERDDLKKEQENLAKQLADSEAARDELQHKADNLSKQFADLQANNRAPANQGDTAKKIADAEAARDALAAKLDESEKARADFKKQLDSVMKELADAEANRDQDVLAAHAETEKLREQLKQADVRRADLEKELARAKQSRGGGQSSVDKQELVQLKSNVQQLKDRLAVLEAKPIPYTQEELALFKKAGSQPAPAPKNVRSFKELTDTARALLAEGDRVFRAHDYAGAEAKFRDALKQDPQNIFVIATIANVQMVAEKYDACEATLQQALALDPDDAGSLYLLGKLRLREDKLDEALDALSRSARINPSNAMTENALGNAFSRKGMRQPAENALRKALQIEPDLPEAHHNLALVYATDRPPSIELAKWHYKKATDGGYPKDPDLEKLLK